jgi:dTDP-4-dehydrorhamnose reductase
MSILVTGANGMLAHAFRTIHPNWIAYDVDVMDIAAPDQVRAVFREIRPRVVINCAAFTDVTRSEQQPELTYRVNARGAEVIAQICRESGTKMVHFGTDFVFPGRPGGDYREDEPTSPVNTYAASKLEGENRVRAILDDVLIVRVSWLYGPAGRNFVSSIGGLIRDREELKIVSDQYNRATYTFDVVNAVDRLLELNASGVFHFANRGVISRYDFTVEIARLMSLKEPVSCRILPIPSSEYPDPTPRPENTAMNCDNYEAFTGQEIPDWKDSLARHMNNLER